MSDRKTKRQPMANTFGARLGQLVRTRRGIEGLTQQQLAERAFGDVDRKSRISELESGRVANPQQKTIDQLVVALNISPEEIERCRAGQLQKASGDGVFRLGGPLRGVYVEKSAVARMAARVSVGAMGLLTSDSPVIALGSTMASLNDRTDGQTPDDGPDSGTEDSPEGDKPGSG